MFVVRQSGSVEVWKCGSLAVVVFIVQSVAVRKVLETVARLLKVRN